MSGSGVCMRLRAFVLAMTVDADVVEPDLAVGRLRCPGCEGPLARWGFARRRAVRMLDGMRSVRPRRARCHACETTHVLLPAFSVPRRRDGAEVIGEALLSKALGDGHRKIAARLGRPPGTVRGWLRTFTRRADAVAASVRPWAHAIEGASRPRPPAGSPLADAVDALGTAAMACRLHLRTQASPWELAVALTGLLYGRPRDPPGFSRFAPVVRVPSRTTSLQNS